jgi:hypothetical protein
VALDVFVVGTRVVAFHRNDGFFGFTGEDNLFVQTRNGVRVGLAPRFVTTLQYDVDYDKSPAGRTEDDGPRAGSDVRLPVLNRCVADCRRTRRSRRTLGAAFLFRQGYGGPAVALATAGRRSSDRRWPSG